MRLLSITVKNYRIHQEVKVDFDRARTLIGGPNESGKSTLVEAAHRALFLRAKTRGKVLQGMTSSLHTGPPMVTLSFEARGQTWEVEKRFKGATGQTRLSAVGGQSWQGEEAESKLAELLGIGGSVSREKELLTAWPHLWIWQGRSGEDPAEQATEHRDALVQRLQSEGLAAVMQSDFDQRVKDRIAGLYEEFFTPTGKSKAGSKPEVAKQRLEEAEAALASAEAAAARLEEAVRAHADAESILKEVEIALPKLQKELKSTQDQLVKVGELRALEKDQLRIVKETQTAVEGLRKEAEQLSNLRQQLAETETMLKPLEERLVELESVGREVEERRQKHEARHRELTEALRAGRARLDLAAALIAVFEKSEARDGLKAKLEELQLTEQEMQKVRHAWSELPSLKAADVAKLRTLEGDWLKAVVVRDATAAELKVLAAGEEVWVNGQRLQEGEGKVLAEEAEVLIGKGTRLRLRPGGGTSLADARAKVEEAKQRLQDELSRWSLRSVEQAAQLFEKAEALRQEEKRLKERWNGLGGEQAKKAWDEMETSWRTLEAEMQLRLQDLAIEPSGLPNSLSVARQWEQEMREALTADDKAEREERAMLDEARSQAQQAEALRRQQLELLAAKRQSLSELRLRIQMVEEKYECQTAREEALTEAVRNHAQTKGRLEEIQRLLADLQPAQLELDVVRLQRSVNQFEQKRQTAETQLAVARSQLVLDGRSDPQAELQQARARVVEAREFYAVEQRREAAVQRLHELFEQSREAIDRRLVQPLADRISSYLQCVFGAGAELRVLLDKDRRLGFEVSRAGGGAFAFETLSGGAKEQVAAAVRLAMAEILAAEHDGCLPLIFDDAFAYADPERVQQMQRMLDLAASRGLQIVVLTCNPADYSAFGAVEVRI